MLKMKLCALAPIALVLLNGCSTTSVVTAENLCKDWRHITVSREDKLSDKTASQIEANDYSRVNWGCKLGRNEAKKG